MKSKQVDFMNKFVWVGILLSFVAIKTSAQSCLNCSMDSKTTNSSLIKYGFEAYSPYASSNAPLVKIFHRQTTAITFDFQDNSSGSEGGDIYGVNFNEYYGDGDWDDNVSETSLIEYYEVVDPFTGANSNNCSGYYNYTKDGEDNRSFVHTSPYYTRSYLSYHYSDDEDVVKCTNCCLDNNNIKNWVLTGTIIDNGMTDSTPYGSTNPVSKCILDDYSYLATDEAQMSYYYYYDVDNYDPWYRLVGSETYDLSAIKILGQLYSDAEFRDNLESTLTSYPDWNTNISGAAWSRIDNSHTDGSGQNLKFRLRLPAPIETNVTYLVTYDIVTKNTLFNPYSTNTSRAQFSELLGGASNPTNDLLGQEHEIEMPAFYCTSKSGGICEKTIEVVDVQIIPNNPPGGPGPNVGPNQPGCMGGCISANKKAGQYGGVQAQFSLGASEFGKPVGMLQIDKLVPDTTMSSPQGLSLVADLSGVQVVTNDSQLRQVLAPQALADIIKVDPTQYKIDFYLPTNVIGTSNGLFQTQGTPFASWVIQNPGETNSNDALLLSEVRGGQSWTYAYNYDFTNKIWKIIKPGGLSKTEYVTTEDVTNGTRTVTQFTGPTNSSPDLIITQIYKPFPWGEGVVSEIHGTGDASETTTRTYYENIPANGSFLPVKQVIHPDGSGEYFEYVQLSNGMYVKSKVRRGFGDNPSSESSNTGTEYSYTPVGDDDGTQQPSTPRTIVEFIDGSEVSRNYLVLLPGERRDIRCTRSGVNWNASDNLVTITKYYTDGPNIFRTKSIKNPDGTMSFYDYASSTNGWQTNTVCSGQANGGETAIVDGTQTTTILDTFGHTVSVTAKDIASGATLQQDTYGNFDALDRAQLVTHLDGTSNVFNYACCYLESTVDRDGVTTAYLHDAAKRQYGYQKFINSSNAITYQNSLDAAGRTFKTSRVGTTGSTIIQSQMSYDTAGELVKQTNALNGVTSYVESHGAETGALIRTTTYADGGTRIESYYVNGTLKSVTGTAVHGVRYEYGAGNDDIGNAGSYTKEIKLNEDGSDSSEWTKTFTDMAGRTTEVLYPDGHYSRSYYNNKGQLWKQVDPDGVTTLYTYNAKGEMAYTIKAVADDTRSINDYESLLLGLSSILNGSDRITWTINDVTNAPGTAVRRSRTYVWLDGQSTGTLTSQVETSVDGLQSWQVRYGEAGLGKPVTNTTVTALSGTTKTVTTTVSDGSYTISVYSYGRLISSTRYDSSAAQIGSTSYSYDTHGRQYQVTDARNGATTYGYNNADQVTTVAAPMGQATTTLYDTMLRPYNVQQPDGTTVTNVYLLTGELGLQYGSRMYPVAYGYDYAGRMKSMTNWSNFGSHSGARVTTWDYDSQRGWLKQKSYPDATTGNPSAIGPTYEYTGAGRLASRTWVRGVSTTYGYDNAGSLTNIVYSDETPGVTNSYDRLGRLSQQSSADYQLTATYNLAGELLVESFSGGILGGLSVTNGYDQYLRRNKLVALSSGSSLLSTTYGYDNASRLQTVSDGNNSATYSYFANSPLVQQILFKQGSNTRMTTTKSYDYLNRLTQISSAPSASGSVAATFNYSYNDANQRTKNVLADGSYWIYQYDSLGQVTNGVKYFADGTLVPGQQFGYLFDDIGNRKQTTAGGDSSGANKRLANYSANNLNQITQRDYPGTNDVIGAALATNSVLVNGEIAWRKGEYFWATVKSNNTASAQWEIVKVSSGGTTNTGNLYVPQTPEQFSYDADGNLTNDGRWSYVWDAENRLIQMTVNTNVGPQQQLTFTYDPKGRRIQKVVATGGVTTDTNKFLYDGWNLVAELKPNNSLLRSYVWGSDLSGSLQGAGGVGGLLEVNYYGSSTTNCFPAFDGNGNVMTLIGAADGTVSANYAYGPFGETVQQTGVMAKNNPFRFSTKYQDDESDLLYYGYRYYKPSTGTWPNRDPLGEIGFKLLVGSAKGVQGKRIRDYKLAVEEARASLRGQNNLYCFVENSPIGNFDPNGLDVYKVVISADLSSGGSSVDHREVVGDDGNGGVFVVSFNQDPDKGLHLLGASCCGRGSVTVNHYANTTAADWIKSADATIKVHVDTGYPELDSSLSKMADGYANYHPIYILGFNDCGSIANKFMDEVKDRTKRYTDSHFPDNFWEP